MADNNGNRKDPFVTFRFKIECDKVIAGGFSECSGLQVETEVETYREGGLNEYVHKFPKGTKYGTITLKRGVIDSDELRNWHKKIVAGTPNQRKNISILLMDNTGNTTKRWNLKEALPIKWSTSEFKAGDSIVLVESLELIHHGFTK